jgi:hypothetical protein
MERLLQQPGDTGRPAGGVREAVLWNVFHLTCFDLNASSFTEDLSILLNVFAFLSHI